jgi:BlaI family transcriptional regulator, penicillinase repressor
MQIRLSGLEQTLMDYIWSHAGCTAEACREALSANSRALKESTVRTLLHRLELKGYVTHEVEGRTYIYRAWQPRQSFAAQAVKQIVDRFCGGSVEQLLAGMVDNDVVDRAELERMVRKIASKKKERK